MDKEEIINIAKQYIELIRSIFKVKKAIVFGSSLTDKFTELSDIDIAVFVDELPADLLTSKQLLFKYRRGIDPRIEPVLFYKDNDSSGFITAINNSGEVIYSQ